jgi:hypothetical protein
VLTTLIVVEAGRVDTALVSVVASKRFASPGKIVVPGYLANRTETPSLMPDSASAYALRPAMVRLAP